MYRGGFNQAADNLPEPLEVLLGLGFATLVAPENDMPCIQAWPLGEFHCSVLWAYKDIDFFTLHGVFGPLSLQAVTRIMNVE